MDRTSLIKKLKGAVTGKLGTAVAILGVGAIALTMGLHLGKSQVRGQAEAHRALAGHGGTGEPEDQGDDEHDEQEEGGAHPAHAERVAMHGNGDPGDRPGSDTWLHRILGRYARAWESIQAKVDVLRTAEGDNERLRLENTQLRLQLEGLQFNCSAKEASTRTQAIEYKLDKETGSMVGRSLASIAYRVPTNLVPGQLYTLGISYFKAREDEKAAVIFTFLTGLDENDAFKSPKNFLLTGIAWYRLDNFATADRYFDRALKAPPTQENLQTLAHARLWKALTAQRLSKHTQSQFWLTELIDHHPLSVEASWVNSKVNSKKRTEAHRGVAADDGED